MFGCLLEIECGVSTYCFHGDVLQQKHHLQNRVSHSSWSSFIYTIHSQMLLLISCACLTCLNHNLTHCQFMLLCLSKTFFSFASLHSILFHFQCSLTCQLKYYFVLIKLSLSLPTKSGYSSIGFLSSFELLLHGIYPSYSCLCNFSFV